MLTPRCLTPFSMMLVLAACSTTAGPPPVDASSRDTRPSADNPKPEEDVPAPPPPPDAPPKASGIGDPCESSEMFGRGTCRTGQVCLTDRLGFRNGYCVAACLGSARCPADAVCTQLQGFPVCLRRCASNEECRREEGYICGLGSTAGTRVCRTNDEPVGRRPDGEACYTTTAGPTQRPALARRVFAGTNFNVSNARGDSEVEAEGNIVVHPMNGNVASSYIAASRNGSVFMGVSFSSNAGMAFDGWANINDPLGSASDPVLDFGRDGTLRMTFIGLQRNAFGQVQSSTIRITESSDSGRTWATPRQVEPANFCNQGGICDKPWIISGPGVTAGTEAVYIGYLQQTRMGADVVMQRSDDGGRTWAAPTVIGRAVVSALGATVPNLVQMAVGAPGEVATTWVALSAGMAAGEGSAVRFGSPDNRIFYRRTRDGFRTLESSRVVSRVEHSPVYTQPPVALDGTTVHVAFVSGNSTGAWDLILATSSDDGATWRYRKVNDEPDACATHAFPAMVVDTTTHDVHLIWMENRFGDGAVAYARCPGNPAMPCGTNEAVSDRGFRFTTGRSPMTWHGDYLGLTLTARGDLWATWSDTRLGVPAMFVARGRAR